MSEVQDAQNTLHRYNRANIALTGQTLLKIVSQTRAFKVQLHGTCNYISHIYPTFLALADHLMHMSHDRRLPSVNGRSGSTTYLSRLKVIRTSCCPAARMQNRNTLSFSQRSKLYSHSGSTNHACTLASLDARATVGHSNIKDW